MSIGSLQKNKVSDCCCCGLHPRTRCQNFTAVYSAEGTQRNGVRLEVGAPALLDGICSIRGAVEAAGENCCQGSCSATQALHRCHCTVSERKDRLGFDEQRLKLRRVTV